MSARRLFELTTSMISTGPAETRIDVFDHDCIIVHHCIARARRTHLAHGSGCTRLDRIRYDFSFDLFPRHLWVMDSGASYELRVLVFVSCGGVSDDLGELKSVHRQKLINAKKEQLAMGTLCINVPRSNDRINAVTLGERYHSTWLRQPGEEARDVKRSMTTKAV